MAQEIIPFDWKKACQGKIHLKHCDMDEEMKNEAVETTTAAIDKFFKGDHLAGDAASRLIKESLDKSLGPYWHCVIGEGFSFEITCQRKNSILMYYAGVWAILIWKC
jgi:dynein light chain 4